MKILIADYWNDLFTANLVRQLADNRELEVYYLSRFGMDAELDRIVTGTPAKLIDKFAKQKKYLRIPWADYIRWGLYNHCVLLYYILVLRPQIIHIQHFEYWTEPLSLIMKKIMRLKRNKMIRTVHDVIPHRWLFRKGFLNAFERAWLKWVLRNYDHLIVHTLHGKKVLERYWKASAVTHIHLGMSKPRQVNKSKKPILLIAGNLRSNKNIDLAIKAFQMLDGKTRKEWQLCIRGRSPYSERRYREVIENLIRNDGLGIDYKNCYLDEKEFDALIYESAYMILLYTSFESQSGIVARSINQSTPFICTGVSSFTEILGEESAIFCKPNVESVMLAFQKASQEGIHGSVLRAGNMQNIYETFSWEKSAEEHIKLYNRLK